MGSGALISQSLCMHGYLLDGLGLMVDAYQSSEGSQGVKDCAHLFAFLLFVSESLIDYKESALI